MTSIDIMSRRSRIFELHAQGIKPSVIQSLVAPEYEVSERTVRSDLQTMKQWLPILVKMTGSSDEHAAELLGLNQLIRQRLMNLAETSKHDPSRVGALKGSLESIKNEMTFLQSLGKVDKVADKIEAEVDLITETRQVIDWSKLNDAERSKLIDAGRILIRKRRSEEKPSSVH